jgi:hypothetical protein
VESRSAAALLLLVLRLVITVVTVVVDAAGPRPPLLLRRGVGGGYCASAGCADMGVNAAGELRDKRAGAASLCRGEIGAAGERVL